MILMQGAKRVFETPTVEDASSTSSARAVSIYGVSSYDDIVNSIIHIRSLVGGIEGAATININELGAKNIKIYKSGSKQNLPGNWTSIGQIYTIYYDGTDFILSGNYDSSSSSESNVYEMNLSNFVTLSESSTTEDITNAFGGEDEIAAFKYALNYGTITGYTNSEINNTKYTCIYQNSGVSSESPNDVVCFAIVNENSGNSISAIVGTITFAFRRGENNAYTAVKVLNNRLADITNVSYSIPSTLLDLSTVSEETILEAFGGEQQVELFKQAILSGTHMTVGNAYTVLYTTTSSIRDTFIFYNPSNISITKVELIKSESTGNYSNITITTSPLATKQYIDSLNDTLTNSINEINNKSESAIDAVSIKSNLSDYSTLGSVSEGAYTLSGTVPSYLNFKSSMSSYGRLEVKKFSSSSDHVILTYYPENADGYFYIRTVTEELGIWYKFSGTAVNN